MHTYEFIFKCKRCEKEVWEHVTSPDILTREKLDGMEFQLTCPNPGCGWIGKRTGAEAEKIMAALKPISTSG
jgi:hypothetical protein